MPTDSESGLTKGAEFWKVVQDVADECECRGWLHKFRDQHGIIYWELTPLGRRSSWRRC
jgi:hypothetical protein